MANIPNKEKDEKKDAQNVLLTAEEYARQSRIKTKERINRITRVAGVFAILLIAFEAILDPLFEFTYFGWIWDQIMHTNTFSSFWAALANGDVTISYVDAFGENKILATVGKVFDDTLQMGPWIAQLGITILYIGTIVLLVYFITYCVVDLIELVRSMYAAGKDITRDLLGNMKDTVHESENKDVDKVVRKPRKKSLFKGNDVDAEKTEKKEKEAPARRREVSVNDAYSNLSQSQLDDLLSGKNFEDIINIPAQEIPSESEVGTKQL